MKEEKTIEWVNHMTGEKESPRLKNKGIGLRYYK